MDPQEQRKRVGEWIAYMRAGRSLVDFAADVTATTGWHVDHSRLSRYENASIPIGRGTIEHFADYADKKGLDPLDLSARKAPLSLEERAVLAAERQAAAAERQADTLALLVDMLSGRTPLDQAAVAASLVEAVRVGAQSQSPLAAPQPDRESA